MKTEVGPDPGYEIIMVSDPGDFNARKLESFYNAILFKIIQQGMQGCQWMGRTARDIQIYGNQAV